MKKKQGWLINDCLTCIPDTRTLWHFLLDIFPNLIDKTGGYTAFHQLKYKVENELKKNKEPDFIIRNASYFPVLDSKAKTISILQDIRDNDQMQIEVCNKSDLVVCVSNYVREKYKNKITTRIEVIPVGTDFLLFDEIKEKTDLCNELQILPNSIIFIGAANAYPKGFDILMDIVNKTNYNFCFVMKDDWFEKHPRIRIFNKVNHDKLKKIINACDISICTSKEETLHLAGVECAACNLPLISSNVGIYHEMQSGEWGRLVRDNKSENFIKEIDFIFNNKNNFNPRNDFIKKELDLNSWKDKWIKIIDEI